jgi:glycosyltransferase involved in cell wall biosynthesis
LRILYSFPHTIGKPGISTSALHQIIGLIEQGDEIDVVCTKAEASLEGARSVTETMVFGGLRLPHRALGVHRAYAYHDRRTARILSRAAGEVELVHTWPAGCLRTLDAARRLRVPSFREVPSAHTATAYEDAAREAASLGMDLPSGHHHRYNLRKLDRELREFEAADFLLVPSAYVERTFVERGVPPSRLIRHRYGYDPASFAPPKGMAHADGGGLTAVFVGRGEPNKGLHHALWAWVNSGAGDRGQMLICGEILPEYRERLAALLAHPSVHELGFQTDVGSVMREADVLVLPSVTEGSALVTYEAQAEGCALLVSEAAGAECENGREGLVHAPGDVATLTEQIRRIDRDRSLLRDLQANALANAVHLTWSAAGQRLHQAYSEGLHRLGDRR